MHLQNQSEKETIENKNIMSIFWIIIIVLIVLWFAGFTLHVAGGLIHLLLVIAVIVLIIKLIRGERL